MTDNDRFKDLEGKMKELRTDNDRLELALTHLTEALIVVIEKDEDMSKPDATGPGYLANN